MFGSQYYCEQFFSLLKYRKNDYSNQIKHKNVKNSLRIECNKTDPDFKSLVK